MKTIFLLTYMIPLYAMSTDTAMLIYGNDENGYKQDAIYDVKVVYYNDSQQRLISAYIHLVGQDYVVFNNVDNAIVYQIIYDRTSGIADAQIKRLYGQAAVHVLAKAKHGRHNCGGHVVGHKEKLDSNGAFALDNGNLSTSEHKAQIIAEHATNDTIITHLKHSVHSVYAPVGFCLSIAIGLISAYLIYMRSTVVDLHTHYLSCIRWSTWKDEKQIACLVRHGMFENIFHDAMVQKYHDNDISENAKKCLEDINAEIAACNEYLSELQSMERYCISSWLLDIHSLIEEAHAHSNILLLLKNYLVLYATKQNESAIDSCTYSLEEVI